MCNVWGPQPCRLYCTVYIYATLTLIHLIYRMVTHTPMMSEVHSTHVGRTTFVYMYTYCRIATVHSCHNFELSEMVPYVTKHSMGKRGYSTANVLPNNLLD